METSASEVTRERIRATEIAKTKSFGGAINTANKASFGKEKKKKNSSYSDIFITLLKNQRVLVWYEDFPFFFVSFFLDVLNEFI